MHETTIHCNKTGQSKSVLQSRLKKLKVSSKCSGWISEVLITLGAAKVSEGQPAASKSVFLLMETSKNTRNEKLGGLKGLKRLSKYQKELFLHVEFFGEKFCRKCRKTQTLTR